MPTHLRSSLALLLPAIVALQAAQRPKPPSAGAIATRDGSAPHRFHRPEEVKATGVPTLPSRLRATPFVAAPTSKPGFTASAATATSATYTFADLNRLSYADLVNTLVGIQWNQVTDLFQYNADSAAFYKDSSRVQYLIDALQTRAATFSASDNKGIPTLVEVLRSGFFLAYYHSDLAALNTRAYQDKCLPAIRAAQSNAAFRLGTAIQDGVIESMGMLIGNADSSPDVINGFIPILQDYNAHWVTYGSDSGKGRAIWQVISGIDYDLTWGVLGGGGYSTAAAGPFAGTIDGYLNQVFAFATTYPYGDANTSWLIDSAVYLAGYDGRFHSDPNAGLRAVTTSLQTYGTSPWRFPSAQAAEVIHDLYGDTDATGLTRDWSQVQQQIRGQYTPVKRDFDGGLFHTQVGANVDPTKVKTLVWAHKETKAQFFRALRSDQPVDPNHHQDDALTMVIYNSPDDYKMNRFAYGLNTNNGGIMIESLGTFFTYERTPAESYYSLEELFRHEGVHYLQGRYEEPGFFGDSPLYDADRLTWIDEGSAEFFAGSTRTESVKPRIIKAQLIQGYDPSTWYSVNQVVTATYASGWTFYDYACEFVDYLYHNQWDAYLGLLDKLRANDPAGFSAACAADGSSATLNAGYKSWLQYVSANANSFPSPSTSPDYLAAIPARPLSQVVSDIQGATSLAGITTSTTTGLDWNTFTLRGSYAAGPSKGSTLADWQSMDAQANAWLASLTAKPWSGFKTVTCYFVNYAKDASNKVSWQVVFHGVNTDGGAPANTVSATINAPASNVTLASGATQAFSGSATDSSASATLTYAWTFGDGATATGASPSHIFTNPGSSPLTRTVTFTATDSTGVSASATRLVTVNPAPKNVVTASINAPSANVTLASGATQAFSGSATDSSASATLTYAWTFGDGATATGASPSHVFTNSGSSPLTLTVTFTATDSTGVSTSATRLVTVNPASSAPTLNLKVTAGPGTAAFAPNASANVTQVIYWVDTFTPVTVGSAPFGYVLDTSNMTPGSTHAVYARATTASGAFVDSGWVNFTVISGQLGIGAITVTPQAGGKATFTPALSGSVAKVIYFVDTWTPAATVTSAPWVGTVSGLASGTHYVNAQVFDAAGHYVYGTWTTFVMP